MLVDTDDGGETEGENAGNIVGQTVTVYLAGDRFLVSLTLMLFNSKFTIVSYELLSYILLTGDIFTPPVSHALAPFQFPSLLPSSSFLFCLY
jgi:hypothetical protein